MLGHCPEHARYDYHNSLLSFTQTPQARRIELVRDTTIGNYGNHQLGYQDARREKKGLKFSYVSWKNWKEIKLHPNCPPGRRASERPGDIS